MKNSIFKLLIIISCIGLVVACQKEEQYRYQIATSAGYAPMEFFENDKIVGFDIDLLATVMETAGLKYDLHHVKFETLLDQMKMNDTYDAAIASITLEQSRLKDYDFSYPYFQASLMIMIKEGSDITSAKDLMDKRVAVQLSTTADAKMTEIMGIDSVAIKRFDSNEDALSELINGNVDAVVADNVVIYEYINKNDHLNLLAIPDQSVFQSDYFSMIFPKNSELKLVIDKAIKEIIENGTYKQIYKKWFGEDVSTKALLEQMSN